MSRLEQSQIMNGGALLHSNIGFDTDPDTPIGGNDGGQIGSSNPILSLHAVHKFGEGVSGGVSLVSISGAVLDYNDEWAGRFQNTSVDLLTLSFVPSLAYQVTDWLSIGAGLNVLYGNFDAQVAVPPPNGTGRVKIDDADGADTGVIASALFEPAEGSRFGLVYQSKIQPTLKGQVDVNPVDAEANIDIKIPLAETVLIGAYQELSDQWALLGSLRWENWSQFGDIPVTVERGSQSVPTGWRDTYGFSVGMHFRPTDAWLLQAGFGYDTSPVSDRDRSAALPLDRQYRYATGVQYQLNERVNIGGSFVYADYGDNKIDGDTLKGRYSDYDLFFFGLNLDYRFGPPSYAEAN